MPVVVKRTAGFLADLERQFDGLREKCADRLVAKTMRDVMSKTPVEDGHAHEAWSQAVRDVAGQMDSPVETSRVAGEFASVGSGNEKARHGAPGVTDMMGREVAGNGGWGWVERSKGRTEVALHNELLFVELMEEGGMLVPISPGGAKMPGTKDSSHRYPFLHPRSAKGRGLLQWIEGGQIKRAPSRVIRKLGLVGRAVTRAARLGRKYGKVEQV